MYGRAVLGPGRRGFTVTRRSLVLPELKEVDVSPLVLPFVLNAAVAGSTINIIRVGAGYFQRVGNRVCNRKLKGHFNIVPVTLNGTNAEDLRVIIVYDRQTNGANFVFSDLVQQTNSANVQASLAWDYPSNINKDRFLILRDWRIASSNTNAAQAVANSVAPNEGEWHKKFDINMFGLETIYGADGGGVGDIKTGAISVIVQGNTGGQYSISLHMRLMYQD